MMILYHGSESIVNEPTIDLKKTTDDFGPGFYLTDNRELASEWACSGNGPGYVNGYSIDTSDLDILDLDTTDDSILQWLSLLLQNRTIVPSTITMNKGMKYIQRHHTSTQINMMSSEDVVPKAPFSLSPVHSCPTRSP